MAVTTREEYGVFVTRGMILEPKNRFAGSGHTFLCILAQMVVTVALGLLGAAFYLPSHWEFLRGETQNLNIPILIAAGIGLLLITLFFILDQLTGFLQNIKWLKKNYPFLIAVEGVSVKVKLFCDSLITQIIHLYRTVLPVLLFFGVSLVLVRNGSYLSD
jgi:hypothetical protein